MTDQYGQYPAMPPEPPPGGGQQGGQYPGQYQGGGQQHGGGQYPGQYQGAQYPAGANQGGQQQGGQYPGGGGYPGSPYPGGGYPGPAAAGPPPQTVTNAVYLMFLQVVVGIVSAIITFATLGSVKDQIRDNNPSFDTDQIDTAARVGVITAVIFGIIFAVLYILLALQVRKGKNWARIVTWVLAALGALFGLIGLGGDTAAISKVFSVIGAIIEIAIIVFLALGPSNAYFRRRV